MSLCPDIVAPWSAVSPEPLFISMSAPACNSNRVTDSCPKVAASYSAVQPSSRAHSCLLSKSAPLSNSIRTTSSCPPSTARYNAVLPKPPFSSKLNKRFPLCCECFFRSIFSASGRTPKYDAICNNVNGCCGLSTHPLEYGHVSNQE